MGDASRSCIALVAAADIGQHRLEGGRLAAPLQFQVAALGPHLRGRGYVDLNVGIRADHRADVAAVEHGAGRAGGEVALELPQRGPHLRDAGHDGGRLPGAWVAQVGIVQGGGIEAARGGHGGLHVVEPGAAPQHVASNRAVEEARIEVVEPEAVGDALAERAFARAAGPSMAMIMARTAVTFASPL